MPPISRPGGYEGRKEGTMNRQELRLIRNIISNAQDAVGLFACGNYPYTDFKDDYFREVFYQLNDIGFSISKKIAACDENAETD